jgi:hypothetical protein
MRYVEMYQWAEKELESVNLEKRRCKKRLIKIVEDLASQPGEGEIAFPHSRIQK